MEVGSRDWHSELTDGHAIFCLHVLTHSMIRYVSKIHWDHRTRPAIGLWGVGLCDCTVTMSLTLLDLVVSRSTSQPCIKAIYFPVMEAFINLLAH